MVSWISVFNWILVCNNCITTRTPRISRSYRCCLYTTTGLYFLFLYELLKYDFASGPYVLLGILVIPGIAFGALFLAPFLDNGPGRRPPKRPIAVAMMLLALASV